VDGVHQLMISLLCRALNLWPAYGLLDVDEELSLGPAVLQNPVQQLGIVPLKSWVSRFSEKALAKAG
jgi:hypothetical protein